jgi:hypothetical protein
MERIDCDGTSRKVIDVKRRGKSFKGTLRNISGCPVTGGGFNHSFMQV